MYIFNMFFSYMLEDLITLPEKENTKMIQYCNICNKYIDEVSPTDDPSRCYTICKECKECKSNGHVWKNENTKRKCLRCRRKENISVCVTKSSL